MYVKRLLIVDKVPQLILFCVKHEGVQAETDITLELPETLELIILSSDFLNSATKLHNILDVICCLIDMFKSESATFLDTYAAALIVRI